MIKIKQTSELYRLRLKKREKTRLNITFVRLNTPAGIGLKYKKSVICSLFQQT